MDMGKAIREGRERLGMSQEALAERLSVSRQAVSKWEMGTSVPSPENRRALSEILGADLQVETEAVPSVPLGRWKRLTLAAGLLCLALLAALAGSFAARSRMAGRRRRSRRSQASISMMRPGRRSPKATSAGICFRQTAP